MITVNERMKQVMICCRCEKSAAAISSKQVDAPDAKCVPVCIGYSRADAYYFVHYVAVHSPNFETIFTSQKTRLVRAIPRQALLALVY